MVPSLTDVENKVCTCVMYLHGAARSHMLPLTHKHLTSDKDAWDRGGLKHAASASSVCMSKTPQTCSSPLFSSSCRQWQPC